MQATPRKKRVLVRLLSPMVLLPALLASLTGQSPAPSVASEARIDELIQKMTLEEKAGQLSLFTADLDVTGPSIRANYREAIEKGRAGALFNAFGAKFTREMQRLAVEKSRLGIPLLFGYDVIHGHRTIFPIPLAEAASWDLEAIERSARVAAIEASASGLHWTFAPMVDIARDPRWGRIAEGAGEDVYLGSLIAAARVKGFQGDDLSRPDTILACAKHFAAYGAAEAGRDYNTVDVSERVLREVYLPPFKSAVDAGVATVMTSFNELDGVPATANSFLLDEILRKEWGFRGFVVTDYTSTTEMIAHGTASDSADAARQALNAGVDMDMQSGSFELLPQLVREGRVEEKRIDEAVRDVLRAKERLGLFTDPYQYSDEGREKEFTLTPRHLEAARDMARKSLVLLRNDGTLPLDKGIRRLAVIGPLADDQSDLLGSWFGAGDSSRAVTLLSAIRERIPQAEVVHAQGCSIENASRDGFAQALEAARGADAVVLAVGESAAMSGEAASRSKLDLPGVQLDLFKALLSTGKPIVVVLMNGRPLAIGDLDAQANAILEAWFGGLQAGPAIADALFGDFNPSGKLPVTFPRSVGQVPLYYSHKNTGRPMDPRNKYTSKYLDVGNDPLYPFGFGLSYTTFQIGDPVLENSSLRPGGTLTVRVKVKNTGRRAGTETVQLYVQDLVGSVTRPVKELKRFEKITLEAGRESEIVFSLRAEDLAFLRADMSGGLEPGAYKLFVGANSRDVSEAGFLLTP